MVRFFFLLLPIVLSLPKSIQCIFFRRNLKSLYLNNTYLPIYASLCVFDCWKKKYLMKLSNFFNWLGINFWEKKLYHFLSHLKIKVSETNLVFLQNTKQYSWWLFHKLFTFLTKSVTYYFWNDTLEIFDKIIQWNQFKNKH